MKYLIAGLGNIGAEYHETRHNIGFKVLDAFAEASNIVFEDKRYGFISEYSFKSRIFILLKPTTYMNRSGLAINYWLKKAKLSPERLFIIVDDIALPFGTLRLRLKGGDGGHNGLASISQVLGTQNYARLRFGIGNNFFSGQQIDYVLSEWTEEEKKILPEKLSVCNDIIKSFGTLGMDLTMTRFNNK